MIDEIYDDVLSVMKEKGFVSWFSKNHLSKTSPLMWSYDNNCERKSPTIPPKNIKWKVNSYDILLQHPYTIIIDGSGYVSSE